MLKEVTIKLDVDEKQLEALKELLPVWQQYTSKDGGEKPFADLTEEKLLEYLMAPGSRREIWLKIKDEQYRQGMINTDELLDDKQLTVAQRKKNLDSGL